jgi:methylisocitrate lyase
MTRESAGRRLRRAVERERPLQIVGAVNAYCAMLAEQSGFGAVYLSGAGVANASYGLPDLGVTTLENVLEDARRITGATKLPLLVDADTGWGGPLMIARTVREMERAGAAGLHIEDQVQAKRCGHRPGKVLVSAERMCARVKAAVDARADRDFVLMARTDAYGAEELPAAIDRACRYVEAGADMVFAEAMTALEDYRRFASAVKVPLLANLTEFGNTPLFSLDEMRQAGVAIVLYPLSAFRAMSAAACSVYQAIRKDGSQQAVLDAMQTREELYAVLKYHEYEGQIDDFSTGSTDRG